MTPSELALIELVVKLGIDGALAVLQNMKNVATIDDAIAALQAAKLKTAQQYIEEAKAQTPPVA